MRLYYRCSRFLLFCAGQLQKGLPSHIRKVWILIRVMVSSNDHGYCIWQERYYGQYKNRGKQKFNIPSDAFDESKGYSFDNYIYYYPHRRSEKRTQIKRYQCFYHLQLPQLKPTLTFGNGQSKENTQLFLHLQKLFLHYSLTSENILLAEKVTSFVVALLALPQIKYI